MITLRYEISFVNENTGYACWVHLKDDNGESYAHHGDYVSPKLSADYARDQARRNAHDLLRVLLFANVDATIIEGKHNLRKGDRFRTPSKGEHGMIIKVLEASTVHVTPDTMDMIDDGRIGVTTMAGPYGALVAVLDDAEVERKIVQEVELYPLLDKARAEGCAWVYLDPDADPIDGLPTYENRWT